MLFIWSPGSDEAQPKITESQGEITSGRIPIVLDGDSQGDDLQDTEESPLDGQTKTLVKTTRQLPKESEETFEPPITSTTQTPRKNLSDDELLSHASLARGCRLVPQTRSALNKWVDDAYANDELPERIEWFRSSFEKCQDVDRNFNYIESYKTLAEKGHQKALWNFWNLTDAEVFRLQNIHQHERDAMIAARQQFNVDKYTLAEKQVLQGNERAMMRLMYAYQHLDPVFSHDGKGQNYIRSLAMALLTMENTDDQNNYRRAQWHKNRLEQRMKPKEIEIAIELSAQLSQQLSN